MPKNVVRSATRASLTRWLEANTERQRGVCVEIADLLIQYNWAMRRDGRPDLELSRYGFLKIFEDRWATSIATPVGFARRVVWQGHRIKTGQNQDSGEQLATGMPLPVNN